MPLTPAQVTTIRSTAPLLQSHGQKITEHFYDSLLQDASDLNNAFNQANQRNHHQAQALAASLYAYATHIDDLGALSPAVERICQKHASLYVRPEQYDVVGRYLLKSMGEVLGPKVVTPAVGEAWGVAYEQLANLMIGREGVLMRDADGWTDWRKFKIARKAKEAREITSFYLEPVVGQPLPPFRPGQYVSVRVDVPKLQYKQARQYSLSDAPYDSYYRISVKRDSGLTVGKAGAVGEPGYVSNILHDHVKEGDVVEVSHAAGAFHLDLKDPGATGPVVLISAGVGVTPMVSILNSLLQTGFQRRISWIHATRNTDAQAFGRHVWEVAEKHQNVSRTVFVKNPDSGKDVQGVDYQHEGRMRLDLLEREKELCLNDGNAVYYVCGPKEFMRDVNEGLIDLGVEEQRVRMEVFGTGDMRKA